MAADSLTTYIVRPSAAMVFIDLVLLKYGIYKICYPQKKVNSLRAKFFGGNKNMYLHMSFLNIDIYLFYIVSIMGADVMAMQGARPSAATVLETKASPSVRDWQLLVRTSNFVHISL